MRTIRGIHSRLSRGWRIALAATAAVACGGVAHAAAPKAPPIDPCATPTDSNYLVADATKPGTIDLVFYNAKGARVVFFECVGDRLKRLGAKRAAPDVAPTIFEDAAAWSCDRVARRFAGVSVLADGTIAFGSYSVRTPSCTSRFTLSAPRRMKPGAKATVRVVDRWGIGGIHPDLCIGRVGSDPHCKTLAFPHAVTVASRRFRASERGRWRVELRAHRARIRAAFDVGGASGPPPKPLPIVLASGDSTMQGIDSFLSDELAGWASVVSDARPGSGVSRGVYWEWHAKSQTKRLRQRATVMSVGAASDGMPIPNPIGVLQACCGEPWIEQYANRVRGLMQTFLREGRGRVVWLTPPEPRYGPRAQITHAVNVAIERAAEGLEGVKVLRIDLMFSPHGYADSILYRGRQVRVRESDGVHLNVAGTAIAAKAVAEAIRELH